MRRLVASLLLCLTALLSMPQGVGAFGVSPALLDLSGKRGETIPGTFTLINTSAAEQSYYLGALSFFSGEDSGEPQFVSPDADQSELTTWIQFPHVHVTLSAGSKADVPFQVSIPDGALSGSYHAAIVVSDTPPQLAEGSGSVVRANMAVLVFLTVEGETVSQAAVLDFSSAQGGPRALPSFDYQYRVQNQGNVDVKPSGTVTVRDAFGRVLAQANANEDSGRILPKTTRAFHGHVGPTPPTLRDTLQNEFGLFAIGPVTVTLALQYGNGQSLTAAFTQWVFPWHAMLAVVAAIALALLTVRILHRLKRTST